jgi:ATP synthase F1 complex assembly factor 1
MSAILTSMRSVHASSSRLMIPRRATLVVRAFSSTVPRSDIQAEIDKRINPREVIEKKRKEFEDKYGDKLKKRVEK